MSEISAERSSTLIFPLPIEIMRLVDTLRPLAENAVKDNSAVKERS